MVFSIEQGEFGSRGEGIGVGLVKDD